MMLVPSHRDNPIRDGSGKMFDRIASRYDFLNRVTSLGLDHRWRRHLVRALFPGNQTTSATFRGPILDVATGTADVALEIALHFPKTMIVGLDPSQQMLTQARKKLRMARKGEDDPAPQIRLMQGDAQRLPFADNYFGALSIAFGIRNIPDRAAGLREMVRVTRPGGTVAILELTRPESGWIAPLARLYMRHIVPRLGAWLSRAHEYRYLERSIVAFPPPEDFLSMMEDAGFRQPTHRLLGFGAVALFSATV